MTINSASTNNHLKYSKKSGRHAPFVPVVIIGAGRSGTNILRDVLTRIPGFETWPCDEINYIWRYGNKRESTDEFNSTHARPEVVRYVRSCFKRLAVRQSASHVVEKTCANSLRVEFVDRIVPEAFYVYIVRDGRDAAASAALRWKAPLDLHYLFKKARFVPAKDIPYYAGNYFLNRLHRLNSKEERVALWGPRFEGMDEALQRYPLEVVCSLQWKKCVDNADRCFNLIDPGRVHALYYENLVDNPVDQMRRILDFLCVDIPLELVKTIVKDVVDRNVGKWKQQLNKDVAARIESLARDTLNRHGYL